MVVFHRPPPTTAPKAGAPRILFVVTSFDRGGRLGRHLRGMVDKLDYMLMIMDEIREACEVRRAVCGWQR